MDDLIKRWQRAMERASEEQVRVIELPEGYVATSSSQPLKGYRLTKTPEGWSCECKANAEYHLPCKHLASLAELLDLDVLTEIRGDGPLLEAVLGAA